MDLIQVTGWTDWSTGKPRPVFTVDVLEHPGVFTVETFKTGIAAKRLEHELAEISKEIDNLMNTALVGSSGFSEYALYAMVYLAAVRANVNPEYVRFVYDHGLLRKTTFIYNFIFGSFSSPKNIYDPLGNLGDMFDPRRNMMKVIAEVLNKYMAHELHGKLPSMWYTRGDKITSMTVAIDALVEILSKMKKTPDVTTRFLLIHLLASLTYAIKLFKYKMLIVLTWQNVKEIFRRAAEEARDPDVRELAEIYAELIDNAEQMARELYEHLGFETENSPLYRLSSPKEFKEGIKEVLRRLDEAKRKVLDIELKVYYLKIRAYDVLTRLMKKGIFLDAKAEEDGSSEPVSAST